MLKKIIRKKNKLWGTDLTQPLVQGPLPHDVCFCIDVIFELFKKERNITRLRISLQINLPLQFAAKIHLYVMTQYPIYTFLSNEEFFRPK